MKNGKEGSCSIMKRDTKRELTLYVLSGVITNVFQIAILIISREDATRWPRGLPKLRLTKGGWQLWPRVGETARLLPCRAVHSLPSFSPEGLPRWVMRMCGEALAGLDHLVQFSKTVVECVSKINIGEQSILSKIDIKN